jgi:hypothetical protein
MVWPAGIVLGLLKEARWPQRHYNGTSTALRLLRKFQTAVVAGGSGLKRPAFYHRGADDEEWKGSSVSGILRNPFRLGFQQGQLRPRRDGLCQRPTNIDIFGNQSHCQLYTSILNERHPMSME